MSQKDYTEVSLDNIANGAANELFTRELEKVMENIDDVNADAEKTRKITLEIFIKPSANREMGEVRVACTSRLAGVKPVASSIFFFKNKGKPAAYRHDMRQSNFGFEQPTKMEVIEGAQNA
jgi:hypothetical protein